jgi:hypothetical protein
LAGPMKRRVVVLLSVLVVGGIFGLSMVPGSEAWFSTVSGGRGNSMSHGPSQAGILDDGDLGNYQRNPAPGDITPMVTAQAMGLAPIAGDHGDVITFRPDGEVRTELGRRILVEHRALVWVAYDEASGLFDVPELGLDDVARITIPSVGLWDEQAQAYVRKDYTLVLAEPQAEGGWAYPAGQHSGWVTKGDHNRGLDQSPGADGQPLSTLVQPAWVEGRLLRVVDQDAVVRDALVGTAVVLLLGVAFLLAKKAYRGPPPKARLPLAGDDPFEPLPKTRGDPLGDLVKSFRASCEACGTPWRDQAFCLRCGAERAPKNRYGSREERDAAAARAAGRRR